MRSLISGLTYEPCADAASHVLPISTASGVGDSVQKSMSRKRLVPTTPLRSAEAHREREGPAAPLVGQRGLDVARHRARVVRYPREAVRRAVFGCRRDELVDVRELERFEHDAGTAELDAVDHGFESAGRARCAPTEFRVTGVG